MATSATIVDQDEPDAARKFASRFFGVDAREVATIGEAYQAEVWRDDRFVAPSPSADGAELLELCVHAVEAGEDEAPVLVAEAYAALSGRPLAPDAAAAGNGWQE